MTNRMNDTRALMAARQLRASVEHIERGDWGTIRQSLATLVSSCGAGTDGARRAADILRDVDISDDDDIVPRSLLLARDVESFVD